VHASAKLCAAKNGSATRLNKVGLSGHTCVRAATGCTGKHTGSAPRVLLTVNSCIKVRLDLQADKSPVVVKGPFFPRVVNPRYRIHGTNV
jgi:hypothetical protein